jgi:hypothetical protein
VDRDAWADVGCALPCGVGPASTAGTDARRQDSRGRRDLSVDLGDGFGSLRRKGVRRPLFDGTTAVALTPMEPLKWLAALVPAPKRQTVRYFGSSRRAPASGAKVIREPALRRRSACGAVQQHCDTGLDEEAVRVALRDELGFDPLALAPPFSGGVRRAPADRPREPGAAAARGAGRREHGHRRRFRGGRAHLPCGRRDGRGHHRAERSARRRGRPAPAPCLGRDRGEGERWADPRGHPGAGPRQRRVRRARRRGGAGGLCEAARLGLLDPSWRAVLHNAGSGLKDVAAVMKVAGEPRVVRVDPAALDALFGVSAPP